MHQNLFPLVTTLIVIISIQFHKTSCNDDEQYKACNSTYKCGEITIPYPFWGASARPDYCGYPGFELFCDESSSLLTVNISAIIFRVLNISFPARAITVARQDYWGRYCPSSSLLNTTIDFKLFNYASNSQNLSLYYDCPSAATGINLTNQYMCGSTVGYYMTRELSAGELAIANSLGSCNDSVKLPVFETGIESLIDEPGLDNFIKTIDGGFGLEWIANNSLCNMCGFSGGECGRNVSSGEFVCYCADGPRDSICDNATSGKNSNNASLIIGLIIAGVSIGVIGICILLFVRRKQRMKKLETQSISKGLTAPSSRNGISTSATDFSRTTPSYFSSEFTDLEKGSMYFGVQLFTYNELEEATNNFDPSKELGEGGFGVVYYGKLCDGRVVAVKRLFENSLKRVEQFINEVEILAGLRHPNLVSLYGCTSKQSPKLLLVYEYIPNGTVADHLHGLKLKNSSLLTWPVRLSIAIETAGALAYLHKSDIIHRDVKTNNILLDNAFRVKVADFGLSRLFPTDVTHVSTAPQGTPGYVDPEYYLCYQLTDKSDVYSFGVVLVELITSLPAVDTNRHRHDINLSNMAITKIQNHTLHELIDPSIGFDTDDGIRRMVTLVAELAFRCLQHDRDMRPSMEEVLEHLKVIQKGDFEEIKSEVVDISFSPESEIWANSSAAVSSF